MVRTGRGGHGQGGFTLIEMMITLAVLGLLVTLSARALTATYQFFRLSMARTEIQRNARITLDLMNRNMRQARASTVVVTRASASQPPYSKVVFDTMAVSSMSFWQEGKLLKMQKDSTSSPRTVAEDLRYLAFTYGETGNETIMSVSVAFEKDIYSGGKKALQMAVEKVRLMND
jgi:prepilin-type N-terminal cleavage/methylation domain-containing protein